MKRELAAILIGSTLFIATAASAEQKNSDAALPETVVSANRYETPLEQIGSSVTVINAKEIEQRKQSTVRDILRDVPGLDVVQTGTFGGTTSIFMRGSKSDHTLILMDGVELNDPSQSGGGFDFANLTTDNIERIEVLRGPQSTLYGSQAIGGVINIITKRGKGRPSGYLSAEGGSFYTAREKAGISGGTDLLNYSFGFSRMDTAGYSAASSRYKGNSENDGYQNTALNSRLGITPHKNLNIDLMLNYLYSRTALDLGGGANQDDPNNSATTEQISFRSQAELSLFNDLWQQKLGVSLNDINRHMKNGYDSLHPNDASESNYHGQAVKFDWQHILNLHKSNILTVGVDRREERASSDSKSVSIWGPYSSYWNEKIAGNTGVYLQDQIRLWDAWSTTAGFRVDDHSQFGTELTYRFTSAYELKKTGTTFKASYGTGFKAPSLFQLYAPTYGVSNLKAETSSGWDAGIEQNLEIIKTTVGVTYFNNKYNDLITYTGNPTKYYDNISSAKSRGVEAFVTVKPVRNLTVRGSYTYTYALDNATGLTLQRIPRNKFNLNGNYRFLDDKANINVGLIFTGTRRDMDYSSWPYNNVKMKDYVVVNLAGSYDITKNVQLFGRIDNLFDRYYEEVNGYGTSRLAAYGGIKLSF